MSTAAGAPAAVSTDQEVSVSLRDVERELDRQLKAAQGPGEAPVVRARMSNLVIFCDSAERARQVDGVVPDVVAIHPARVLLLVSEPGSKADELEVSVRTRVHEVGTGLRAFSEQVTIRGDGAAFGHLPFAVRALSIGDLPTNLWWAAPQPPAMAGPLLYNLSEDVDQVVYDSFGWPEPARGMSATASWIERFQRGPGQGACRVVADLAWRRLKHWRRLIAQALDPATAPGAIQTIGEVLIEHGPHSVMMAWGLASWLAARLGWRVTGVHVEPAVEIHWQLAAPEGPRHVRIRRLGDGPRGIRRVRVACQVDGKPVALAMTPEEEGRRLSIVPENAPGAPRTMTVQPQPLAELLGRQLSDRERDPVFCETMKVAQELARSVLNA
jgi:glucose-6-phosphate dehydrogenase assembly protein OpcA